MIVAMFTNNFAPNTSGVTTSITRLSRGLKARGHAVHVFAPWVPHHRDSDIMVHRVVSLPLPQPWIPLSLPYPPGLSRAVARVRPDIFHAHHPFLLGRDALRLARRRACPIVFTYHAMYEEYVHFVPLLPEAPLRSLVRHFALDFSQRVDAVIAPSESLAATLRSRGLVTPLHVVPTGIDPRLFERNEAVRKTTREMWGVGPQNIVVVSFARLSREKKFDMLLTAFARLVGAHSQEHLRLVLGGEGPARERLEKLSRALGLERHVLFAGPLPHEAVPSFLAGGDLFAYASTSETQGLVTLEALAAGLPAVVVDAPGNRDVVQDRVSGLITAVSPEAIATGLSTLVEDQTLRKALADGARKRALDFSEDVFAKHVEHLYASLLR